MVNEHPVPWDIWYAKVHFEEFPNEFKKRPVLIIEKKEGENLLAVYISLKITSHPPRHEFAGEYVISQWREAGLKMPSTVRTYRYFELEERNLIRKLGRLEISDIRAVQAILDGRYL